MDITTITTADFQAQFFRDFPYLNVYDATATYSANAQVYYGTSFWRALVNGLTAVTPGTDNTKWQQVNADPNSYVQPQDISNAFLQAQAVFNTGLFNDDNSTKIAYLYCSAHYLVHDLRAAMQGINGVGTFGVNSRGVGSMSESYNFPDFVKKNAQLNFFTTTPYGMKYLSLLVPLLVGNFVSAFGGTNP